MLDVFVLGRLAQKALVGGGVAHLKDIDVHLFETSNAGDEHVSSNRPSERGGGRRKAFFRGNS